MDSKSFYRQLLDTIASDEVAAVMSEYSARADGSFGRSKEIIGRKDTEAWQKVDRLWSGPASRVNGPVCSFWDGGDDESATRKLTVIERYTAKPRMIILGGGHIAVALSRMAALLDFEITIFDDRPSFANSQRFSEAKTVICDSFTKLFERVQIRANDYVVIVTRGHKHDADCLRGLLADAEPLYTGMIGSRRRVAIVMDQLREEGFDGQRIERIHSPIGLRIGAFTPAEIAVSILAEVIQVRRLDAENMSSCDLEVVEALAGVGGDVGAGDGAGAGGAGDGDAAGGGAGAGAGSTQVPKMDALITIFDSDGSVPIDCGAKLAMSYDGRIIGTIGGGCSESDAMRVARELINKGDADAWRTHTIDMTDSAEDDGMVCGGQMQVVIERPGGAQ